MVLTLREFVGPEWNSKQQPNRDQQALILLDTFDQIATISPPTVVSLFT